MDTVTVSQKFQVIIPETICNALRLRPGQKLRAIQLDDRIELIPVRSIKGARGFLKGIDTSIEREAG